MQALVLGYRCIRVRRKSPPKNGSLDSLKSGQARHSPTSYFKALLKNHSCFSLNCASHTPLASRNKEALWHSRLAMSFEHISVPAPVAWPLSRPPIHDQAKLASPASWPSIAGTTLRSTSSYATHVGQEDFAASPTSGEYLAIYFVACS